MCAVELEELALDYLAGLIVPGDSDVLTFGADGIEKELHDLCDGISRQLLLYDIYLLIPGLRGGSTKQKMEVAHTFYAQPPRHKHLTNPETKKGADLAK